MNAALLKSALLKPGPSDRMRRLWRQYTRMRTAIILLMGVALIVLVGSFVPQQDTSAQAKVDEFLSGHGHLESLASTLGFPLTEVFVSPVFFGLLGLLYVALGACVLRRGRALVRRIIRRLRRSPQFWGECGSWLFHASFFILLVAVVAGKATGFQGITTVAEGDTFVEARVGYDTLQEGFFFAGRHTGYQVRLNSFKATYASTGAPQDYVSNVTVFDHGRVVETKDIRVNEYLGYRGVDLYQQDYGWAPHIVVRNPSGVVVFDGLVKFFGNQKSVQTGVVKVADFGYQIPGSAQSLQLGGRMAIFPDAQAVARVAASGSIDATTLDYRPGGMEARNPVVQLQLFVGDLNLGNASGGVNELDTSRMQPYFSDAHALALPMGQTLPLPLPGASGASPAQFTVSFPDLRQYSLFMVKRDDGVPFVYVGFACALAGLVIKLYVKPLVSARRPSGGGTSWRRAVRRGSQVPACHP